MTTKPALAQATDDDFPPLTKRELALLKSRVDDLDDPTRFVIVSPFSRRFCLYYTPSDGVFIMNRVGPECLFKRKAEAQAVAGALRKRRKRDAKTDLQVIAVKKTAGGVRFVDEIQDRWNPDKRWKPILKRNAS